jgi:hypothetical protein
MKKKSDAGSEDVFVSFSLSHRKKKSNAHTNSIGITFHGRTTIIFCITWMIVLLNRLRKLSILLCNNVERLWAVLDLMYICRGKFCNPTMK